MVVDTHCLIILDRQNNSGYLSIIILVNKHTAALRITNSCSVHREINAGALNH